MFLVLVLPVISMLVAVEVERTDSINASLSTLAVIALMLSFLLLYIVYIIPKPQHFSRNFLCVYVSTSIANMLLFMAAMVIFVFYINTASLTLL